MEPGRKKDISVSTNQKKEKLTEHSVSTNQKEGKLTEQNRKKSTESRAWADQGIQAPILGADERERRIAYIVEHSVLKPQKLTSALFNLLGAAGIRGVCFGVWDCMLLALLLDGALWAAVYEAAKSSPQFLGMLVFLASPVLYAMLHLFTVWKERMAGMYETLMVCRMSLRQMTVLRLLLFSGASAVLLAGVKLWVFARAGHGLSIVRMLCMSMAALFLYAWIQTLVEWKFRHRMAYAAAPAVWAILSVCLLFIGGKGLILLEAVPDACLLFCAAFCAGMYARALKKYFFEPCEAAV